MNSTVNNSSKHILKRLSSYISRLIKTRKKIYYSWRDVSSLFILNTVFFLSLSLATLFFCIYFITYLCNMYYSCIYSLHLLLSLPNNVWRLIVFAPFYYYYSFFFFPWTMNLSTADLRNYWTEFHEAWWSYRYMFPVGPKVFSFVVKGVKVMFWGVQRGWRLL